jgi:hypothetical protein
MGIYAMAHRYNVPLQVFSGETTPILGIGSAMTTERLLAKADDIPMYEKLC